MKCKQCGDKIDADNYHVVKNMEVCDECYEDYLEETKVSQLEPDWEDMFEPEPDGREDDED